MRWLLLLAFLIAPSLAHAQANVVSSCGGAHYTAGQSEFVTVDANGGSCSNVTAVTSDTPFTALHTYYLSPTGSDAANGLTPGTAWLTPNHAVVCGDVIVAATGAYNSTSFDTYSGGTSKWGTVSSCPSTSGGIDGTGGVYVANVVCATAFGCNITATTSFAVNVSKSNWAMTGFTATNTVDGDGSCFIAIPAAGTSIAYVAFINNIASTCSLEGVGSGGYPGDSTHAVDEFAAVGNIAFNSSQSGDYCGSGMAVNVPQNVDSLAGTHVFFSGNFSYANINGACSPNSNFVGNFTTATGNFSAGAGSITVAAVTGWGVGWPIQAYTGTNHAAPSNAIVYTGATPTLVSSVAGTTIGLSNNVASPGITNGQQLAIGTSSDGEGLIFDTWGTNSYAKKAVVKNNVMWGNGNSGFAMFCAGSCSPSLIVKVYNNTLYGNSHDYKHDGPSFDINWNGSGETVGWPFTVSNNLVQEDVIKPLNSTTNGAIGQAGTGQPVVAMGGAPSTASLTGWSITGNYFASKAGASCPVFASCDASNSMANYNGYNFAAGNTLGTAPGFASPATLPTTAPSCGSYTNVTDCMNTGAGIYAKITPGVAPTSKGYQPPSACAPDADYPTWLKGIVYLQWTGSALVQKSGLITKPCGV